MSAALGRDEREGEDAVPDGPLTVRLAGPAANPSAVASDDSGRTWELPTAAAAAIRDACRGRGRGRALPPPTAAAAATFAEAAALRVVDAGEAPPAQRDQHWVRGLAPAPGRAPSADAAAPPSKPLVEVLDRRSSRLNDGTVDGGALAALLERVRAPRERAVDAAGRAWASRPVPSAGGTHCVEALLYVSDATDWDRGWYRYDDDDGAPRGVAVADEPALVAAVTAALRQVHPPAASLVLVAQPRLLHDRYPNGSALLWRDAGCLLAIGQLVAVDVGLSATPLGICVPLDAATGVVVRGSEVVAVGALALGAG